MFVIEDEAHAEPQLGEFTTFAEAVDELKRRAEKTTLAPNIMLYMYSTPRIATMLAIRLPPDIEARLDALARATGRSKSFYARAAIVEHLADMEEIYLAERRLEDIRAGRGTTMSLHAVKKSLDLAD